MANKHMAVSPDPMHEHAASPNAGSQMTGTSAIASAPETSFCLLCRAGTQLCALPIQHVHETMRMLPIETLAGTPDCVRGLCIIRGSPVPLIDAATLLFGQENAACGRMITVRVGTRTIAIAVAAVLGVRAIGSRVFDELPPLLHDISTEAIAAVAARDAESVFVLRTGRIVPDDLLSRIDDGGARA
jgi:purine-binding chemotaxis protein CheW